MEDRAPDSLSRAEQRLLRELETDLRREDPDLATMLEWPGDTGTTHAASTIGRTIRRWSVATLGVIVIVVGLGTGAPLVGIVGCVLVIFAADRLLADRTLHESVAAIRRAFRPPTDDPST